MRWLSGWKKVGHAGRIESVMPDVFNLVILLLSLLFDYIMQRGTLLPTSEIIQELFD